MLKLSGIGPKAELTARAVKVRIDLAGVGANLQDRYEVGVVTEFGSDLSILGNCTFGKPGDPCLAEWQKTGQNVYSSNGAICAIVKKSTEDKPVPDLIIFALPGFFKGYFPGYSKAITADKNHFTWAILKAHTGNTAGFVKLKSTDPRDMPVINFKYFHEGSTDKGQHQQDLDAVVNGVELVRAIGKTTDTITLFDRVDEILPGPAVKSREQIASFVRNEAWGHHASCTCKIGAPEDPMAVLDSKFKVRGTSNLRVVDASVFPKIPGFFIVLPIYMVSEKATDVILAEIGEVRKA